MKSKILYVICLAYFISGFAAYNISVPSLELLRKADPSITAHTDLFTLHQIGLIFMISTTIAALLTLKNKVEWGYSLLTFVLSWWAMLYLVSWAQTGHWQSVYGFVNYGLITMVLILCSKIAEMPEGMRESQNSPLPLAELDFRLNKLGGDS
jgi:hypothetical protein